MGFQEIGFKDILVVFQGVQERSRTFQGTSQGLRSVSRCFRGFQGYFRGVPLCFKGMQGVLGAIHRVSEGFKVFQWISRGSMGFERFQKRYRGL